MHTFSWPLHIRHRQSYSPPPLGIGTLPAIAIATTTANNIRSVSYEADPRPWWQSTKPKARPHPAIQALPGTVILRCPALPRAQTIPAHIAPIT